TDRTFYRGQVGLSTAEIIRGRQTVALEGHLQLVGTRMPPLMRPTPVRETFQRKGIVFPETQHVAPRCLAQKSMISRGPCLWKDLCNSWSRLLNPQRRGLVTSETFGCNPRASCKIGRASCRERV